MYISIFFDISFPGDTPDDMKAAVGANIHAVGVVPPGLVADRSLSSLPLLIYDLTYQHMEN